MNLLAEVQQRVAAHMDEILACFKPGAKITLLVRTPDKPTADFMMTDDAPDEAVALIRRRQMADGGSPLGRPFPAHAASLQLTHNQHKAYYLTVAASIEQEDFGYTRDCWISDDQKQKAIDTDDCWTLQWYPHSPVGFCTLSAADLDALLAAAGGL